jgi:methionyl aminopeptidase
MILLKTQQDIERLKKGGAIHSAILRELGQMVVPGITTWDIEVRARELLEQHNVTPAFLGYQPEGASSPFPAATCVSVNQEVVHGIPKKKKILVDGDVVSIDLGVVYEGMITDSAITVVAGTATPQVRTLLDVTHEALMAGINEAHVGARTGDIGAAIESYAKAHGFGIVRGLSGHGVGYHVHEDPYVPNYGKRGTGEKLVAGMVIAIEPMFTLGKEKLSVLGDGYTYVTIDNSIASHCEHTIAITPDGPIILTQ